MSLFRCLWALGLAACAVDVPQESQTIQAAADGGSCPSWQCGGNSPVVDFRDFHDLHWNGHIANEAGYRIVDVRLANEPFHLRVVDAELQLLSIYTGTIAQRADKVIGTRIRLWHESTGQVYELRVAGVDVTPYWTTKEAKTFTYLLEWLAPPDDPSGDPYWKNVCANPGLSTGTDSMDPTHAVLFEGDRISRKALEVTAVEKGWFNIGCRSHALAKQHLTGHTRAGSAAIGMTTTLAQRTAHLKMLTADYCGNGTPLTVAGTDVHWGDAQGLHSSLVDGEEVEARWTETGAACLNTPRITYSPSPLSDSVFPDFAAALANAGCALPPTCADEKIALPYGFDGAHVVSTNY